MTYQLELAKRATKSFSQLPKKVQQSLLLALEQLEADPFHAQLDIRALQGELKGLYRVRVGSYRIIYDVDQGAGVIRVRQILHRQSAYG